MRQEISLFLGNQEIEFNQPPALLYNYTENDLRNPAVVKNSYSKTLTIEGTPNNNRIFGHFWNLERIQDYGTGSYTGSYFNPLQKADFQLFLNGEIYESGYFRLDEVRKTGNNIEYDITLFGGLGSFFYNLTYSHYDNEIEGPDKLSLKDLVYYDPYGGNPDYAEKLDFVINKETLNLAWDTICNELGAPSDPRFRIINFAPCYNGLPKDFDANKVLINYAHLERPDHVYDTGLGAYFPSKKVDDSKVYTTFPPMEETPDLLVETYGYALGEAPEELTEWEAGNDLRSYLQRPVLRVKALIDACCNPANNLGYKVELDPTFFRDDNPYYERAWLTMPMLPSLDFKKTQKTNVSGASLSPILPVYGRYSLDTPSIPLAQYTNAEIGLVIKFNPTGTIPAGTTHLDTNFYEYYHKNFLTEPREWHDNGVILAQAIAYNQANEAVGYSDLYYLTSKAPSDSTFFDPDYSNFKVCWENDFRADYEDYIFPTGGKWYVPVPRVQVVKGRFEKVDGEWLWCDYDHNPQALGFKFNGLTEGFDHLELKICPLTRHGEDYLKRRPHSSQSGTAITYRRLAYLYNPSYVTKKGKPDPGYDSRYDGYFSYDLDSVKLVSEKIDGFFSGTEITSDVLLSTDKTPCDYLLSYCKQFGLYFYKDPNEHADDESTYPKGVIHILTRNSFYDTENIVDLEKLIDRSKPMKITPQIPATKWYDFGLELNESEASTDYQNTYNVPFGTQRVNTGYNFNSEKTDVFKDNAFKGGIDVLEKNKYYYYPDWNYYLSGTSDRNVHYGLPTYAYNGLKVTLYRQEDGKLATLDVDMAPEELPTARPYRNTVNLRGYDLFEKPQFYTSGHEAGDGDGVLLFLDYASPESGDLVYGKIPFWLTDDLDEMNTLNGGKPCWIMTAREHDTDGNQIAIRRNVIPHFSRYMTRNGRIIHTWDMGKTESLYVPDYTPTEGMTIYERMWKDFTGDMYNVNTKLLKCYCLIESRPNPEWLRRFYWFDNSIWRLNSITDWNVSSYDTTAMEFIKVMDLNDYTTLTIHEAGDCHVAFDQNRIINVGGTVTGYAYAQDLGIIWLADTYTVVYDDGTREEYSTSNVEFEQPASDDPLCGYGKAKFTFEVPANTTGKRRTFYLGVNEDAMNGATAKPAVLTQGI